MEVREKQNSLIVSVYNKITGSDIRYVHQIPDYALAFLRLFDFRELSNPIARELLLEGKQGKIPRKTGMTTGEIRHIGRELNIFKKEQRRKRQST